MLHVTVTSLLRRVPSPSVLVTQDLSVAEERWTGISKSLPVFDVSSLVWIMDFGRDLRRDEVTFLSYRGVCNVSVTYYW